MAEKNVFGVILPALPGLRLKAWLTGFTTQFYDTKINDSDPIA